VKRGSLILCLFLCLSLAMAGSAQARQVFIALGTAPTVQTGEGPTPQEQAVAKALSSILVQALASTLGYKRLEGSLAVLLPVIKDPTPYIRGYQVTAQTEAEGKLSVVVEAEVNQNFLENSLAGLGLGRIRVKILPMVSLSIDRSGLFAWWIAPQETPPSSQTLEALTERLDQLGLDVLQPKSDTLPLAVLDPSPDEAAMIGRQYQAELVLTGSIIETDVEGERLAQVRCQVIDVENAQIVAGPLELGYVPPVPSGEESEDSIAPSVGPLPPAPDVKPHETLPTAEAEEAGERMAALLINELKLTGWVMSVKPTDVQIQVEGVKHYLDLRFFLDALARIPDQIQDVRQQSIQAGRATFSAKLLTTTQNLANLLVGQDYPNFFVSIVEVSPQALHIKLIQR